jgi:alkyl hydroperoxide reductase subunit AhpC
MKYLFKSFPLCSVVILMMFSTHAFGLSEIPQKAPKLPKHGIWFNTSEDDQHKNLKGQITIINFWDYASINSIRNLYYLKKWEELYSPLGVRVIGVHAPDYKFEYKRENVENALRRLGVTFPVLMDNNFKVWNMYEVFLWPTKFIIDKEGQVVYQHVGEGGYRDFEEAIRLVISADNPTARFQRLAVPRDFQDLFDETYCGVMSEEIRVGTGSKEHRLRTPNIANSEGLHPGRMINYEDKGERQPRGFFVHGAWKNQEDYFEYAGKKPALEDYIGIDFEGHEVFGVLSSHRIDPVRFYLLLDSKPVPTLQRGKDISVDANGNTYVFVDEPQLYYLLENIDAGVHELKMYTSDEGATVQGFSFGNRCLTGF